MNGRVDIRRVLQDFQDADPASSSKTPPIPGEGEFRVRNTAARVVQSKKNSATYLVVEFEVLESNLSLVEVGREFAWIHDLTNQFYGAPNAKQWIAASCGLAMDSEEARGLGVEALEEAVGEDQGLAGTEVRLVTSKRITKANIEFMVHTWSAVE